MTPRRRNALAAFSGVVAALVALALAAVIALLFALTNPLVAVGSLAIDAAPPGFKSLVIDLFGTGDKVFLFVVLGVVVLIGAVLVGILEARTPPLGIVLFALIGLVALLAVLSRSGANVPDAVPTVLGIVAGILVLRLLLRRLEVWRGAAVADEAAAPGFERRSFLRLAVAAGALSLVVGAGAGLVASTSAAVTEVRKKIRLPRAASPAPAIPAGADLDIPGISPYIVPNAGFYRIDTALQVPSIDPDTWKLKVTGMVENEVELTFAELLDLPLVERIITLTCVSQEVGGNLIGNAKWLGYPIREVLAKAKPTAGADMVLSRSVDGFTASSPLAVLQDDDTDALLAVGMNGAPLPLEHGFPVRMVVPGLYGYVSATKWLTQLKVTRYADDQAYWTPRGYSEKGPIKLSSRIDTPQQGTRVAAGRVAIAGVAWHQHVGISRVEVRVDDGPWREAKLARVVTVDSWLQWSYAWDATKGDHTITVRAVDNNGVVQTSRRADVVPNGSTGLDSISVSVG